MKLLLLSVALILATMTTQAAVGINADYSPFVPKVITKIDALTTRMSAAEVQPSVLSTASYPNNGLHDLRVAKVAWVASTDGTVGAHSLGVALPAKALIKQSYFYSIATPVSAGGGSLAIHCEDAGNILTAADVTSHSTGAIFAGNETGTGANMVAAIAANCNITATVTSSDYTAGSLNGYVEYVIHD